MPHQEGPTFGVIRWDAWYSHDGSPLSIVSQVEKTLSPAEYHWRAPFFAEITKEGRIKMPKYTQEIFDREMEYAIEAGIDYFAYLWYDDEMGTARKMHKSSKYKNDVKFSICLDSNGIGNKNAREEIKELLKEDFFMTVLDGRPLMYYYENISYEVIDNEILFYRSFCLENGIKEPYAVFMNTSCTCEKTVHSDAISRYSTTGTNNMTFNKFIANVQAWWEKYRATGTQYVPALTFGWHPEPRYKNPVSWMEINENSWVPYPTEQEIYDHMLYALSYLANHSTEAYTKANTMILYAWNEHDEGSWLCPTLAVDKNGNQLYNTDGSKKTDDSRIRIIKKAISDYNAGERS